MDQRPNFELLLGEVSLKAPETPLYLRLAAQVLEARRSEMEDGSDPLLPSSPTPPPAASPTAVAERPLPDPVAVAAATAPGATGDVSVSPAPTTGPARDTEGASAAPASASDAVATAPTPAADATAGVAAAVSPPDAVAVAVAPVLAVADGELSPTDVSPGGPSPEADVKAPARRARWFRGQVPVVTFEDGTSRVMESLESLKELLRSRGLQPHPRGDASMLLWQVRNRLGLEISQVDI